MDIGFIETETHKIDAVCIWSDDVTFSITLAVVRNDDEMQAYFNHCFPDQHGYCAEIKGKLGINERFPIDKMVALLLDRNGPKKIVKHGYDAHKNRLIFALGQNDEPSIDLLPLLLDLNKFPRIYTLFPGPERPSTLHGEVQRGFNKG